MFGHRQGYRDNKEPKTVRKDGLKCVSLLSGNDVAELKGAPKEYRDMIIQKCSDGISRKIMPHNEANKNKITFEDIKTNDFLERLQSLDEKTKKRAYSL